MEELLQAQLNAQRAGVSYAVVTIAEASGSVPRTSGKMLVYADGHSLGTIGGGPAERRAKADALAQLDAGQNAFLHYDFPTPGGASCAGRLSILIEVFQPKPLLVVFGGGHVGTSLLRLAAPTGFRTLLLDDRAGDQIPDAVSLASRFVRIQNVERDILNTPIPANAFFVLCGHDHAVDGEALAAALQSTEIYRHARQPPENSVPFFAAPAARVYGRAALVCPHTDWAGPGRRDTAGACRRHSGAAAARQKRKRIARIERIIPPKDTLRWDVFTAL